MPNGSDATGFVHRWEPPTAGAPDADLTILALHGTGGDEHDLVPLARMLAPGAAVLSPRGPVLENGMPRFFRRLAEGVFDLDDLARRTDDLHAFVTAAAHEHGRDLDRVIAIGFSNGANIAASLLLKHPGAIGGALLLRAMVPFDPAADFPTPPRRPRVTIASGRADPLVPLDQPPRLAELLTAAGCDVTLEWVAAGHALSQRDVTLGQQLVQSFVA
jgi:phospholipase/carboxylesterase